jgi:hypothetical protein
MGRRSCNLWEVHLYSGVFPFFTRVYFDGCNVAEGDAGWLFLQEIAKSLCRIGGGVVFGWTSLGFSTRGFHWPHKWVHPWGDVRYVVAAPGGAITDMFETSEITSGLFRGDPVALRRARLVSPP